MESVLDVRASDLLLLSNWLCFDLGFLDLSWLNHLLFSWYNLWYLAWSWFHLKLELATKGIISDFVSSVKIFIVRNIDDITSIVLVLECILVCKDQVFLGLLAPSHLRLYLRFQGFKGFREFPYSLCDGPANELEGELLLSRL